MRDEIQMECSYCGATIEYIEDGGICECGAGAEWVIGTNNGLYWGGELKFNGIDNILEQKRSDINANIK